MFIVRPCVSSIVEVKGKAPIYAALYFLPLVTFIHALACGLICKYGVERIVVRELCAQEQLF